MLPAKFSASSWLLSIRKYLAASAVVAILAASQQSLAAVEGPLSGDPTLLGQTVLNLADLGYQQKEYFISGQASSYTNTVPMQTDGKWSVKVVDKAAFKTRFIVKRPIDPAKFNGTVIIEWFNVSGGTEASSEWIMAHTELLRKGYVWVGVSAQKGGIDGGGINYTGLPLPIKLVNLPRYISLKHPGDKYAYDIFSQVAQAVLQPAASDPKPLGELQVKRAIATGESQSADFMLTYVNAIAPIKKLFNGYLIHSRLHGSAGLTPQTTGSSIDFAARPSVRVRSDLGVPVMMVQTETDLFVLGSYADRQPDSATFRLWEIAGAGHADNYVSNTGLTDLGTDPAIVNVTENTSALPILVTCDKPINAGSQHFVVKAAIAALDNWLRTGVAPAYADRIETTGNPAVVARDSLGIALGGIRTPSVDVPIATLSGEGQPRGVFCGLFGTTKLFDKTQLAGLYPDHATFVAQVNTSADNAVSAGFLLQPDAALIKAWAQSSNIGNYVSK